MTSEGGLGGHVGTQRRPGHHLHGGSDVDHRPGAGPAHGGHEGGNERGWAPHVQLEEIARFVAVAYDGLVAAHAAASIVDQDVNCAQRGDSGAREVLSRAPPGQVGDEHDGAGGARSLDLVRKAFEAFGTAGGNAHLRALSGERLGQRASDTARRAGDQRSCTGNLHLVLPPFDWARAYGAGPALTSSQDNSDPRAGVEMVSRRSKGRSLTPAGPRHRPSARPKNSSLRPPP